MGDVKRYLNKAEKETMYYIAGFTSAMEELIKGFAKHDKEKAKWARMARTYAEKIMKSYLEPLDVRQRAKVIAESAKFRAYVTYHSDAKADLKKSLALEDNIAVEKEDLLDIVERAVYWCCGCKKRGSNIEQCNLRKLFLKYDVEVFDQYAREGVCPYRNPSAEEIAAG